MKLVFVYNEEDDVISRALSFAHKIVRPSTYKCDLCNLTHYSLGERLLWKAFKKSEGVTLSFYYRKEFEEKYGEKRNYPVIFVVEKDSLVVFRTKQELANCKDVEELIDSLTKQILKKK